MILPEEKTGGGSSSLNLLIVGPASSPLLSVSPIAPYPLPCSSLPRSNTPTPHPRHSPAGLLQQPSRPCRPPARTCRTCRVGDPWSPRPCARPVPTFPVEVEIANWQVAPLESAPLGHILPRSAVSVSGRGGSAIHGTAGRGPCISALALEVHWSKEGQQLLFRAPGLKRFARDGNSIVCVVCSEGSCTPYGGGHALGDSDLVFRLAGVSNFIFKTHRYRVILLSISRSRRRLRHRVNRPLCLVGRSWAACSGGVEGTSGDRNEARKARNEGQFRQVDNSLKVREGCAGARRSYTASIVDLENCPREDGFRSGRGGGELHGSPSHPVLDSLLLRRHAVHLKCRAQYLGGVCRESAFPLFLL